MTAPEFSRPQLADTIGAESRGVVVEAEEGERAALAKRFDLIAIERLCGAFALRRDAAGVTVEGRVEATLVQACSITSDPLPATIDEPIALRFVEAEVEQGDEVELGDADIDVIAFDGGAIDLGEIAAETMALSLDPFPRAARADAALRAAGVLSEEEAGPLGALAALRDKLAGR